MKYIIIDTINSYIVAKQKSVKDEYDIIKSFKTYHKAKVFLDWANKK